jgi:hypothetical protein
LLVLVLQPPILQKAILKQKLQRAPQYQKLSSLKYYLIFIAEQDKTEIIVVSKNETGNWQSETYSAEIQLFPFLY